MKKIKEKKKIAYVIDSSFVADKSQIKNIKNLFVIPIIIINNKTNQQFENTDSYKLCSKIIKNISKNKITYSTSQCKNLAIYNAFKKIIENHYNHIICMTVSKQLSGTYESFKKQANKIKKNNPKVKIDIYNSNQFGYAAIQNLKVISKLTKRNFNQKKIIEKLNLLNISKIAVSFNKISYLFKTNLLNLFIKNTSVKKEIKWLKRLINRRSSRIKINLYNLIELQNNLNNDGKISSKFLLKFKTLCFSRNKYFSKLSNYINENPEFSNVIIIDSVSDKDKINYYVNNIKAKLTIGRKVNFYHYRIPATYIARIGDAIAFQLIKKVNSKSSYLTKINA